MGDAGCGPLSVAMAIVPSLYSRNRLYALYADPLVRHARSRARLVRSVFRQLAGGGVSGLVVEHGEDIMVTYQISHMHLRRRVALSSLELSCLAFLCGRVAGTCLSATVGDRARLDAALAELPGMQLSTATID